jgi:hypothetical protein
MGRMNFAPTARTIIFTLVLIIVGLVGTFGTLLPDRIGIAAFVAADVVLLVGMVFKRI